MGFEELAFNVFIPAAILLTGFLALFSNDAFVSLTAVTGLRR
jgi:hypothetical protein